MQNVFHTLSRTSFSFLGNALLCAVALGVAVCGIGLTALYLLEHVDETPSMKTLQCVLGAARPDCPRHTQEMTRLKAELEDMIAARNAVDAQLAGLQAVETAIDEITLFETQRDPQSGLEITIGTVYTAFVNERPMPDSYFCYINLHHGAAGESRNLHFRGPSGPITLSKTKLIQAGVSSETLQFGRSVCKPFLIGLSS